MTSPFDDRLRDELDAAIPSESPGDPQTLYESLVERAASPPPPPSTSGSGGTGLGPWVAGAAFVGAVFGGLLGFTGFGSSAPAAGVLPHEGVPAYACPGETETAALLRGDRVLIVGTTEDQSWLAVRNVRGSLETVFIRATDVVPDADLVGLPIEDCDDPIVVTAEVPAVGDPPTTTSQPTQAPDTTQPAATTQPTGTVPPTQPADTTPPAVGQASAAPDPIWELDTDSISCGTNPREATVSAQVTDDVAISSVTLSWAFASGSSGSTAMTGSGTYSASFGPFPYLTVPDNQFESVTLTITATDTSGNSGVGLSDITVVSTSTCFG